MILASLLFLSNLSFAQTATQPQSFSCDNLTAILSSKSLSQETKDTLNRSCTEVRKAQAASSQAQVAIADLDKKTQRCQTTSLGTFGGLAAAFTGEISQTALADCTRQLQTAKDNQREFARTVGTTENNLIQAQNKVRAQLEAARGEALGKDTLTQAQQADERLVLDRYNDARLALTKLQVHTQIGINKLNEIERAIDLSVMGRYLKDRMANLLNSKSMCDAAKACMANKTNNIKSTDLNGVFSVSQDQKKPDASPEALRTQDVR